MITVIVPVYAVEPYLDRCVQSIVNQSYKDLEVILVDDGSPDRCPAICDSWADKDNRIRVIHKANGGLSDARNAGMHIASGSYIAFVDSDDWIAPEMLERLLFAINKDESDIAACTVKMIWEDGFKEQLLTVSANCVLNKEEAQEALLAESLLKQPVWYKLYKRETIQTLSFEVGRYHEDVFWSYQAIGNANRISIIDYVGYYYLQRRESIMGEGYSVKNLDVIKAYEQRYKYIAEYFPELEIKARINIFLKCIYHGQMVLKYLEGEAQKQSFVYLKKTIKKYRVKRKEYSELKVTHRLWLDVARLSLRVTCEIKNLLHIGF